MDMIPVSINHRPSLASCDSKESLYSVRFEATPPLPHAPMRGCFQYGKPLSTEKLPFCMSIKIY